MKRLIAFLLLAASAHGADFGDIPAALTLPASNSVRRNAANTAFEAYLPTAGGGPFPWGGSETGEGDVNYTILNTDKIVFTNALFTAAHTWTLPAASTVAAGYAISVIDQQGTVTTTNTLTIQKAAATSDLIYPPNTSVYIMSTAHQGVTLVSDGISKWYAISVQPGVGAGSSGYFAQTSWTPGVWAASLYTLPVTASGSTGKMLQSDGSNVGFSVPTYPATAGTSGNVLTSNGTNWLSSAPAGGGVSSFSAGDLSPIFTTTEPNTAGAVALSFSLSTAAAHTFLGNETGSTAVPHYVQPNFTDLAGDFALTQTPSLAASSLIGRGSASGAGDWERITIGSGLTLTGTVLAAVAGGGGTVTDFSAGDLSPLFTTTEATTTTTPALSFALANAAATTVFGRAAGTSGAPTFSASPQFTAIGNLTTNGFVKTGGGVGTLSVDTSTIPADISGAPYITKVADATLTNEFALGSLATGLLKNTTTTGVPTIATAGTDYADLAFKTFSVSGQSDVVADTAADTMTLAAGSGMTITTNASTDTITFASTGGGGPFPWGGSETAHGDTNYTILNTDKIVYTSAAFTAARTWTMPAASTVTAGYAISVIDRQGTIGTTNTLTVTRSASDLFFPPNTASYIMSSPYQGATFVSDGTSKWYAVSVQPGNGASGSNGFFSQQSFTAGVYAASAYKLPTSIGTASKLLRSDGSNVVFTLSTYPDQNTATGKIIRGNGTNFVESTATYPDTAGTSGNVLTSDGTNWTSAAPAGGGGSIVRTVIARWQDFSGGALATNDSKIATTVPYSGTITGWSISADTGTCTVKWWKKANGTAIPTVSDNINTSGVALSSGTHVRSSTVTDFGGNTTVTAGDMFIGNLTAVSSATWVQAQLEITSP